MRCCVAMVDAARGGLRRLCLSLGAGMAVSSWLRVCAGWGVRPPASAFNELQLQLQLEPQRLAAQRRPRNAASLSLIARPRPLPPPHTPTPPLTDPQAPTQTTSASVAGGGGTCRRRTTPRAVPRPRWAGRCTGARPCSTGARGGAKWGGTRMSGPKPSRRAEAVTSGRSRRTVVAAVGLAEVHACGGLFAGGGRVRPVHVAAAGLAADLRHRGGGPAAAC